MGNGLVQCECLTVMQQLLKCAVRAATDVSCACWRSRHRAVLFSRQAAKVMAAEKSHCVPTVHE